jgi:hypothetical protein
MAITNDETSERRELKHEPRDGWPQIHGAVLAAAALWLVALFVWGAYVGKVASHGAH